MIVAATVTLVALLAVVLVLRTSTAAIFRAIRKRNKPEFTRAYARALFFNKLISMEELHQFYLDHPELGD